jgi:molybdenum cofactor biosynthesis enzyme MoaA
MQIYLIYHPRPRQDEMLCRQRRVKESRAEKGGNTHLVVEESARHQEQPSSTHAHTEKGEGGKERRGGGHPKSIRRRPRCRRGGCISRVVEKFCRRGRDLRVTNSGDWPACAFRWAVWLDGCPYVASSVVVQPFRSCRFQVPLTQWVPGPGC